MEEERIGEPVLSMLYFQMFAWSQSPSLCGLFNLKGWSNSASHLELHKFISKPSLRSRLGYWTISHVVTRTYLQVASLALASLGGVS